MRPLAVRVVRGHGRRTPDLTSAAERVLAERAGGRPQQGQGGPGQGAGGRAAASHRGRPRSRLCPGAFHPPRHLRGQRCARDPGLGGRSRARPGMGGGVQGSLRSLGRPGSDFPRRRPGLERTQVALGWALFLARAAHPVRQTEPVNTATREGPARGAPRKGERQPQLW
jgi:hypothetical protein